MRHHFLLQILNTTLFANFQINGLYSRDADFYCTRSFAATDVGQCGLLLGFVRASFDKIAAISLRCLFWVC